MRTHYVVTTSATGRVGSRIVRSPTKSAVTVPIVERGLWGIAFGNDLSNQPSNTLFFAAGPNDEPDGVYGRIDLNAM